MIVHDQIREPHWAPGAADCLAEMLAGDEVGIEWGGGGSTPWLMPKVRWLHTIEHSADWCERLRVWCDPVGSNWTLHRYPYKDPRYIYCVDKHYSRDGRRVWLIDGYRRIDCLTYVIVQAKTNDIIVCDDALDYCEHLLTKTYAGSIHRFAEPHPHAGTKINPAQHKGHGNTVRTHHAMTKETWIWRV